MACCGKSASQRPTQKSYKKCLEFENNAVGHMTFSGQPTCQPGPL